MILLILYLILPALLQINTHFMQNISFTNELPKGLYQIITPDLLSRMVGYMGIGTVSQVAKLANVPKNTVSDILEGKHQDDLITSIITEMFVKDYEDRENEKFTLMSLAVLYE